MKKISCFFMMCVITSAIFAGNPVSIYEAQKVSLNFIRANFPAQSISLSNLSLIHTEMDDANNPVYYVFSMGESGFIIIAANDAASPVLAYSLEDNFSVEVPNPLLSNCKTQIINKRYIKDIAAEKEWLFYRNYQPSRDQSTYIGKEVPILLTSKWDQTKYYNNYTPSCTSAYSSYDNHCPIGCVPLSMAVLMHYYRYPEYGVGSVQYQPPYKNPGESTYAFPVQEQNFNVLHDFDMMPDKLDYYNGEVARLAWHCGISIQVNYTPIDSYGDMSLETNAMKQYWQYNSSASFNGNSNISPQEWITRIKSELDQRHPIVVGGLQTSISLGHTYLWDGYQEISLIEDHTDSISGDTWQDTTFSNLMIHANFGWGGSSNGYYTYAGGHLDGWEPSQSAIFNLYPQHQQPKEVTGHRNLHSTEGTISDGAGNLQYMPNTDRSWMIYAQDANTYKFKFSRLELADTGDYVAFYPNGDLNNEFARYTGSSSSSQFSIYADSVLVRFVTNANDSVGYGFVCEYNAITPQATNPTSISGEGIISFGGDGPYDGISTYRPHSNYIWTISSNNLAYFSYPHINLAAGDFIDFYDISSVSQPKLLKRIDEYNSPTENSFTSTAHKIRIRFISDNYIESTGFELEYSIQTGISESESDQNIRISPNPANDVIHVSVDNDNNENLRFRLCDMTGRTLWTQISDGNATSLQYDIPTTNFSSGLYLFYVEGNLSKHVKKIIIK